MLNRSEAVTELWNRGVLKWKLHDGQKEIYNAIEESTVKTLVVCSSRQLGKSYLLLTIATEICLQKPNAIVKYICPRQKQVKTILKPTMIEIMKDCPPELRPDLKINDAMYVFPNGSEIHMSGTDNGNHENIRGGKADLCVVDEAGFCNDLDYVIKSVLLPTTQHTNGKVILVSTPSKTPDHEFVIKYMTPASYANNLIIKTIHDNPLLSKEQINEIIAEYPGGEENPEFRREYLCEVVIDEESAVIPEFTAPLQKEIIMEWEKPTFYDGYVAMDPGFRDLTAVLFAYYDFKNGKVIIEDELVMNGPKMTTDYLAASILAKEAEVFKDELTHEAITPYLRVSDNNLILLNDLQIKHKLTFLPTAKDDKWAAINNTRMMIAQGIVIINPRCKHLINHLKGATWDSRKKSCVRSPDNGHYDCVDALIYLLRNVSLTKNPYPSNYGLGGPDFFDYHQATEDTEITKVFKKIFRINK